MPVAADATVTADSNQVTADGGLIGVVSSVGAGVLLLSAFPTVETKGAEGQLIARLRIRPSVGRDNTRFK